MSALRILLTSTASDSHTWNLVFLQLLLEESGHDVTNLGACVPDEALLSHCRELAPDLVVISTVNSHGRQDVAWVIRLIRATPETRALPVVIGGKLGVTGPDGGVGVKQLVSAGFDDVFDSGDAIGRFLSFVGLLSRQRDRRPRSVAAR